MWAAVLYQVADLADRRSLFPHVTVLTVPISLCTEALESDLTLSRYPLWPCPLSSPQAPSLSSARAVLLLFLDKAQRQPQGLCPVVPSRLLLQKPTGLNLPGFPFCLNATPQKGFPHDPLPKGSSGFRP